MIEEAIEFARTVKDFNKEIDLLLSLGESCLVMDLHEKALDAYRCALDGSRRLSRLEDQAYLTGRVGVVLAETGRLDEAATSHQAALQLARERALPELEAEQLSMLAFICREQRDLNRARTYCEASIEIYSRIEHGTGEENARQLLAEIDAADHVE